MKGNRRTVRITIRQPEDVMRHCNYKRFSKKKWLNKNASNVNSIDIFYFAIKVV